MNLSIREMVLSVLRTMGECLAIFASIYWPLQRRIAGKSYAISPWHVWLVSAMIVGPLFAVEQALGYFIGTERSYPKWLLYFAGEWSNRLGLWCDSKALWMRWVPPTTTIPHSIGYWIDSKLCKKGDPPTIVIWMSFGAGA